MLTLATKTSEKNAMMDPRQSSARLAENLLVRDRPRHARDRNREDEEHGDLHAETLSLRSFISACDRSGT
jgi:hypothetical protein